MIYRYVFYHYARLTTFYDHRYREMLMAQYTGRQRSFSEAVKFFTGGSKKYGPSRYRPMDNVEYMTNLEPRAVKTRTRNGITTRKCKKKEKLEPIEPRPGDRTVIFFGDASINTIRGMIVSE